MQTWKLVVRFFTVAHSALLVALGLAGSLLFAQQPAAPQPGDSESGQASDSIRVMSFNIRFGSANDGPNRWELRKELLVETIQQYRPDLLGTQETLASQKQYLDERMPEYESLGVGRDDGKLEGEMTAVWFRRDRFELLDSGHFWLSDRPDQPGSVSWDSALTRMATWVKLRPRGRAHERPLLVLNTHFDHRGIDARRQSAVLLRNRLTQLGEGCDIVVTGDFNAAEDSAPYRELFATEPRASRADWVVLRDSYRVAYPHPQADEGTFNGFNPEQTKGARIDWIGVSAGWSVVRAGIDRSQKNGRLPSDHFPITAEIVR